MFLLLLLFTSAATPAIATSRLLPMALYVLAMERCQHAGAKGQGVARQCQDRRFFRLVDLFWCVWICSLFVNSGELCDSTHCDCCVLCLSCSVRSHLCLTPQSHKSFSKKDGNGSLHFRVTIIIIDQHDDAELTITTTDEFR